MPKKVPNIQRIINNDILKIVNIVFSGGEGSFPLPPPRCVRPCVLSNHDFFSCAADYETYITPALRYSTERLLQMHGLLCNKKYNQTMIKFFQHVQLAYFYEIKPEIIHFRLYIYSDP
jgi:hypothetical protein